MVDYVWKIIQVKMALMIRQLNWKVCIDINDNKKKFEEAFLKQKMEYELKFEQMNESIKE